MANLSDFHQKGASLDHTPSSDVTAGSILNLGALSVFAPVAIASGVKGGVWVRGVLDGPFVGQVANVGDNVYWDANGTPTGGSADGAFTVNATEGDWWAGTLTKGALAADAVCKFALNVVNPNLPVWANKDHVLTAADLTYVAATHNGKVIHATKDAGEDTKITLPTGVAGMQAIIVNDEADGDLALGVTLDGTETAEGSLAIASGETAVLTKGTGLRGDYIQLVCQTNASLWKIVELRGIWTSS